VTTVDRVSWTVLVQDVEPVPRRAATTDLEAVPPVRGRSLVMEVNELPLDRRSGPSLERVAPKVLELSGEMGTAHLPAGDRIDGCHTNCRKKDGTPGDDSNNERARNGFTADPPRLIQRSNLPLTTNGPAMVAKGPLVRLRRYSTDKGLGDPLARAAAARASARDVTVPDCLRQPGPAPVCAARIQGLAAVEMTEGWARVALSRPWLVLGTARRCLPPGRLPSFLRLFVRGADNDSRMAFATPQHTRRPWPPKR
jgi:hypothetical protein